MSELAAALVRAQKKMPAVEKTAKANYGKYATLDDLIAKTRGILNSEGLSIQQFPHHNELGQPVLRTIVRHESGESEQADTPLFLQKQDMQALGAAITYARRYAWAAALGIASEHDDDAQSIVAPDKVAGGQRGDVDRPQRPNGFEANAAADATKAQKGAIIAISKKLGLPVPNVDVLSKREASAKIEELKALEAGGADAAAVGGGFVDDTDSLPF